MSTENKINSNFYQVAVVDANADVTGLTVANITATVSANLGTVTAVTITGGSNGQVLTTNGSGSLSWSTPAASGVTSIDVSGGTTGLTTVGGPITSSGTITITGTLAATSGGTGQSTYAGGDILYASGVNTLAKRNIGSDGQVLTVSSGLPVWAALPASVSTFNTSLSGLTPTVGTSGAVTLAGTLGAISGGTGQTTYATGDILYASNTNTLSKRTAGATGTVLTMSGGVPTWAAPTGGVTSVGVSGGTTGLSFTDSPITSSGTMTLTGVLLESNGGTGQSSYTTGDLLYASSSTTLTKLTIGSSGTVLTSSGGVPTWAPGGGGGTPGGADTQVQYNAAGAFAGTSTFYWTGSGLTIGGVPKASYYDPPVQGITLYDEPTDQVPMRIDAQNIIAGRNSSGYGAGLGISGGSAVAGSGLNGGGVFIFGGGDDSPTYSAGSIFINAGYNNNASGSASGANTYVQGGSTANYASAGGNVILQGGNPYNPNPGKICINGPISLDSYGANTGNFGDVLTSQGPGLTPNWTAPSGGGSPGGSNQQLQYNNGGTFGGISQVTYDGTRVSYASTTSISIADGSSGQFLRTDGSGNLNWATPAATSWSSGTVSAPGFANATSATTGLYSTAPGTTINFAISAREALRITGTGTAVNAVSISAATTGIDPVITNVGSDTSVSGSGIAILTRAGGANSGGISLTTANASGAGVNGNISLTCGQGGGSGGSITLTSGSGGGSGAAGNITLQTTGSVSNSGQINLTTAGGRSGNGNISITAGNATNGGISNNAASITLTPGTNQSQSSLTNQGNNAGTVTINAANCDFPFAPSSGSAPWTAGQGSRFIVNTGNGQSVSDASTRNIIGGAGGSVTFTLGRGNSAASASGTATGGAGGSFNFTAGLGSTATSSAGSSTIGGAGGGFTVALGNGGVATATTGGVGGVGGGYSFTAGGGGAGNTTGGKGGSFSITTGNGSTGGTTAGAGGDVTITLGNAGASSGNAAAGQFTVVGGTATGTGAVSQAFFNSVFVNLNSGTLGRGAPATKTGDFTVGFAENWIICNKVGSDIVVTLPDATRWAGREIMLKNIGFGNIQSASANVVPLTSSTTPGNNITGGTSGATAWATLVSDGTNWIIMQA